MFSTFVYLLVQSGAKVKEPPGSRVRPGLHRLNALLVFFLGLCLLLATAGHLTQSGVRTKQTNQAESETQSQGYLHYLSETFN